MKIVESFFIAIRSLFANKLRSSLTMLGVIIGVGSVITLMSVGRGAETSITSTLEGMGTNLVYVATGDESTVGVVEASSPEFEQVFNYPIGEGQFITERHVAGRDMVVVL